MVVTIKLLLIECNNKGLTDKRINTSSIGDNHFIWPLLVLAAKPEWGCKQDNTKGLQDLTASALRSR
jgi:hypothetical protein